MHGEAANPLFFHDGESLKNLSVPLNTVLDSAPLHTAVPAARSREMGVVSCSYNTPGERISFQAVQTPLPALSRAGLCP